MTDVTCCSRHDSLIHSSLPRPIEYGAVGFGNFCVTVSTTSAPAEFASSANSSSESCRSHFETPCFSRPIKRARSCVFFGRVSIIPGCDSQRFRELRNPFHCFDVMYFRQIQRFTISLPPKPGQLPFGVTPRRLLNRRHALQDRHLPVEQFSNLPQPDHLRRRRAHCAG